MTAVDWLQQTLNEKFVKDGNIFISQLNHYIEQAKQMEKERASTFGIRVFPECSSLKTGRVEIDLHKFENLLNEMYGE